MKLEKILFVLAMLSVPFFYFMQKKAPETIADVAPSPIVPWYLNYNMPAFIAGQQTGLAMPAIVAGQENVAPKSDSCAVCSIFPAQNFFKV